MQVSAETCDEELARRRKLFQIVEWVKTHGEVRALDRIRLKVLSASIDEKIVLSKVGRETTCSDTYLALLRKVATEVVGRPCPY